MLSLQHPPRGLSHYSGAAPRIVSGVLLMAALSFYLLWQQVWLFRSWANVFEGLGRWFGHDVRVALSREGWLSELAVVVRLPEGVASASYGALWLVGVAAALFALSWALPTQRVPARYSLRAIGLVLGLPALGYWVLGHNPSINAEAQVASVFRSGFWFLVVMPWLYALTAFTLPGNLARRLMVVLLAMLYFFYLVPVLALTHWQVLQWVGAAAAAPLNVLLSVLLMSVHVMSFYGLLAAAEE